MAPVETIQTLFFYHLAREFPVELERFCEEVADRATVTIADTRERFLGALPEAHVVVAAPLAADEVDIAANMRLHVIPFAGVNRVPIDRYRERGITLANSHGNAEAVAERAVALALAAAGRVVEFHNDLSAGVWHRRNDDVRPFDYWRSLRGARTAMLGAGAIGRATAELLAPLVGDIVAFRVNASSTARAPFTAEVDEIGDALRDAELVVATLPLTDSTRHILTIESLRTTGRAVFVNVSRAEIVEEGTLFTALETGVLAAAGLDVWYRYPSPFWTDRPPSELPFHRLSNVVVSPHAGSHCEEGKRGQLRGALRAVRAFLRGEPVPTAVPVGRAY